MLGQQCWLGAVLRTLVDAIFVAPAVGEPNGPRRVFCFTVPRPVTRGSEPGPIVVWLAGEHDISTDGALCLALARAMASGPAP